MINARLSKEYFCGHLHNNLNVERAIMYLLNTYLYKIIKMCSIKLNSIIDKSKINIVNVTITCIRYVL